MNEYALRHRIRVHLANRHHYSHSDFCIKLEEILAERSISQPAQVPAGYKLVPIEPTQAQAKAAADAWLDCGSKLILNKAQAAVRASVAAAPGVK